MRRTKKLRLRQRMLADMQLKGYAAKTQKAYLYQVECFAKYFNQSPNSLRTEHIKEYLHHVVLKYPGSSVIKQARGALKFIYTVTLDRPLELDKIPHTKIPKKLPSVLSIEEVIKIITSPKNLKHRAILATIYSAGLRLNEAVCLKVQDIDSKRMQIKVSYGKGGKDRYTILANTTLLILREFYKSFRPTDWLFPSSRNSINHLSTRAVQHVFTKSKIKAGIIKPATVHTLRHCFATHLLEAGVGLLPIQLLLGHRHLRTTMIYLHLQSRDLTNVKSPLDMFSSLN